MFRPLSRKYSIKLYNFAYFCQISCILKNSHLSWSRIFRWASVRNAIDNGCWIQWARHEGFRRGTRKNPKISWENLCCDERSKSKNISLNQWTEQFINSWQYWGWWSGWRRRFWSVKPLATLLLHGWDGCQWQSAGIDCLYSVLLI